MKYNSLATMSSDFESSTTCNESTKCVSPHRTFPLCAVKDIQESCSKQRKVVARPEHLSDLHTIWLLSSYLSFLKSKMPIFPFVQSPLQKSSACFRNLWSTEMGARRFSGLLSGTKKRLLKPTSMTMRVAKMYKDEDSHQMTKTVRETKTKTHTRSDADSGRGGATVMDSFTPKFQDIGEPGLES